MNAPDTRERLITGRFLLVCASTMAFFLAVGTNLPLIAKYVKGPLASTDAFVGVTAAALSVAAVLIRPALGWMGGHHGQKALMVAGGLCGVVGFGLESVRVLPVFIVARLLAGIGDAALFVGASAIVGDIAPASRRAEATSYLSVAVFGGLGLGPIVGDALAQNGHFSRSFITAAAFSGAAALLAVLVHRPEHDRLDRVALPWFHRRGIAPGIVLTLMMASYTGWVVFQPLRSEQLGVRGGVLFGIYSGIVLVGRLTLARFPERVGLMRTCAAGLIFQAAAMVVSAAATTASLLYVGTVLLSVGQIFVYPSLMALAMNSVPDHERGALVPTFTAFFEIGPAIFGYPLGMIAEAFGYRSVFLSCGVLVFCALPALLIWRHRRSPLELASP